MNSVDVVRGSFEITRGPRRIYAVAGPRGPVRWAAACFSLGRPAADHPPRPLVRLLGRLPRWAGRLLTRARPWAVSAWAAARLSAWAGLVSSGPRARVWLAGSLVHRALMGQFVAAGLSSFEMFF